MNDLNLESEEIWDAIAQSFDLTRRKPWKQCIEFIKNFNKNDLIADLCCGNGRHLLYSADYCKKVIGLDISKELLGIVKGKIYKRKIYNIDLLHSDVTNLSIKDDKIDAVLYIASLHNIKGREKRIQSLRELRRILKNDGMALISVWSKWQDRFRKIFIKKFFINLGKEEFGDINILWKQHGLNIPRFYHLYGKKEFIKDLNKANLEIITIIDVKIKSKKYPDNYFAIVKK
jgi:ubiquinone/menaquinone biosynthesis C-methylase UbiE